MLPFALEPVCKDYLWGGTRLRDQWGLGRGLERVAEAWTLAAHPDGDCPVAGQEESMTLASAVRAHPDMVSPTQRPEDPFPVLVKLIDAALPLSIQVHPDDACAARLEGSGPGKTEMWYVLNNKPGAFLYLGFEHEVSRDEVERRALDGTLPEVLKKIEVRRGDAFFIPAGTVHAIGGGILLAEVQQNCNLTYRLFDYGRIGPDGRPRELHLEKALTAARLTPVTAAPGSTEERPLPRGSLRVLADCPAFRAEVLRLDGSMEIPSRGGFFSLLCLEGEAELRREGGEPLAASRGTSLFIPATAGICRLQGRAEFLIAFHRAFPEQKIPLP